MDYKVIEFDWVGVLGLARSGKSNPEPLAGKMSGTIRDDNI